MKKPPALLRRGFFVGRNAWVILSRWKRKREPGLRRTPFSSGLGLRPIPRQRYFQPNENAWVADLHGPQPPVCCLLAAPAVPLHPQPLSGNVTEWLGRGLQNLLQRFESARCLTN